MTARQRRRAGVVAGRATALGIVWWAFAEGAATGWWLGVVVVVAAVAVSLRLWPPGRPVPRLRQVPAFAFWFLRRSVDGGVDVALRAMRRPVDVTPGFLVLPVRLPPGGPSVVLVDVLSLLPGTLAVDLREDRLEMHTIDVHRPVARDVRRLEERIARLFDVPLDVPPAEDAAAAEF